MAISNLTSTGEHGRERIRTCIPRFSSPSEESVLSVRAEDQCAHTLFTAYEVAMSSAEKTRIVTQICTDLAIYAQVEEEHFCEVVQRALERNAWVREAPTPHA